ncbi:MAG: ABC transporter ATP-binding protein [Oscillibacter sp.]|nr:ABC transporter ATP-binding protein [Oscillibacter sp.]
MSVTVKHLYKSYQGRAVLRDVSFRAGRGRVTCVEAPSGGGKTTLFRILMGLESPDSGAVTLPESCTFSAVFQEDRLLSGRDARYNLRFVLGRAYDETAARTLLDALGLSDALEKPVRDYSGGMRRRLALIRALLMPSDVLILDEPFTGTDAQTRRCALDAVRRYAAGRVTLLATHTRSDANALDADTVRLR